MICMRDMERGRLCFDVMPSCFLCTKFDPVWLAEEWDF
jgi:hypothetical protein